MCYQQKIDGELWQAVTVVYTGALFPVGPGSSVHLIDPFDEEYKRGSKRIRGNWFCLNAKSLNAHVWFSVISDGDDYSVAKTWHTG